MRAPLGSGLDFAANTTMFFGFFLPLLAFLFFCAAHLYLTLFYGEDWPSQFWRWLRR